MKSSVSASISRREFLTATATGAVAIVAAPAVITASKTDSKTIVGEGDYKYEIIHEWPQLPAPFTWQTTHNVAVDKGFTIRGNKEKWLAGNFVHPHDACFGQDGSIFVAEWVGTGRISKLKRLS
jgi:hypothetical protein